MLLENSIQAGLGGCRLISAIIKADETITNLGNFVAVEVYRGDAIALLILYAGVVHCPILAIGDGGVHLAFDFPHGWFPLVDECIVGHQGGSARECVPLPQPSLRVPGEQANRRSGRRQPCSLPLPGC